MQFFAHSAKNCTQILQGTPLPALVNLSNGRLKRRLLGRIMKDLPNGRSIGHMPDGRFGGLGL
jgi:hypothetical protein